MHDFEVLFANLLSHRLQSLHDKLGFLRLALQLLVRGRVFVLLHTLLESHLVKLFEGGLNATESLLSGLYQLLNVPIVLGERLGLWV